MALFEMLASVATIVFRYAIIAGVHSRGVVLHTDATLDGIRG